MILTGSNDFAAAQRAIQDAGVFRFLSKPWVDSELAAHLRAHEVEFLVEPYVRNEGKTGEQATLFVRDPAGNALEFKAFEDLSQLFAR